MIKKDSLVSIGSFFKPHGIKGELSATLDFDLEPNELRCIIMQIDSLFVPFFIESFRQRGATSWLIKLDGVESEKDAAQYSNHEIFAVKDELPESLADDLDDGFYLYDLVGFTIEVGGRKLGVIEHIDDTTANVLMTVKAPDDDQVYVPFAEDFIVEVDKESKILVMNLPEGLIDLNK